MQEETRNTNALFLKNAIDLPLCLQGHGQQRCQLLTRRDEIQLESRKALAPVAFMYFLYYELLVVYSLGPACPPKISLVTQALVPEGSSMQVDISTVMTYIHVSPPTIRTLTACLMSLAPAKSEDDENKSTENAVELVE
ncbi:hypothetical protein OS493_034405 [Desmophyllum pertusum]|uniref:Uncharacterized protein n=1 Tax=Desmophyllum pertusum TaxID=174260 RepID=A0A9W9ZWG5_9CNID|nr:hypothetical protein OS493_034405 [Desmophyllum pertusum]